MDGLGSGMKREMSMVKIAAAERNDVITFCTPSFIESHLPCDGGVKIFLITRFKVD